MRRNMLRILGMLIALIPFLVYGKVEATLPDAIPQGFDVVVSVDKPEYFTRLTPFEPPTIRMNLQVFNHSDQPATIEFASGQRFDFEIHDSDGNLIWRWSDGKFFIQILALLTLAPGETMNFEASHRFIDSMGEVLPEGIYTVTGRLASPSARLEGKTSFSHTHLF